jgi:transcriptional regulator with XRE-family HTH domain
MVFNIRLKELREENKKTQKEMAIIMGVSERMYQMYEAGTKEPTISKITNLMNSIGADANYLLEPTRKLFTIEEKDNK